MAIYETFEDLAPAFKFKVEIPNFGSVNFSEVSGLGFSHRTQEYQEGGHIVSKELYTGTKYDDLVLRRGMFSSDQLWDFSQSVPSVMEALSNKLGSMSDFKTTIVVHHLDNASNTIKKWIIVDAWVKRYEVSPLNSSANEVTIESVTLSHSGLILDKEDTVLETDNRPQDVAKQLANKAFKSGVKNLQLKLS